MNNINDVKNRVYTKKAKYKIKLYTNIYIFVLEMYLNSCLNTCK